MSFVIHISHRRTDHVELHCHTIHGPNAHISRTETTDRQLTDHRSRRTYIHSSHTCLLLFCCWQNLELMYYVAALFFFCHLVVFFLFSYPVYMSVSSFSSESSHTMATLQRWTSCQIKPSCMTVM